MGSAEVEFIRMGEWEGIGIIAHGFGMRGKDGKRDLKRDWRGESINENGEVLPLVSIRQVHGDRVVVFNGKMEEIPELWNQEGDALITRVPGFALSVFTADCLPILLFDPTQRVVGIVHAGWKGTSKRILQNAIGKMKEVFNCRGENIQAAMGPCIGPCCLEVDDPVKKAFGAGGLPWEIISSRRQKGKWLLDLYKANAYLLEIEGVHRENVQRLESCTRCRRDIFYSYRGEEETQGRQLNFIALRKADQPSDPG